MVETLGRSVLSLATGNALMPGIFQDWHGLTLGAKLVLYSADRRGMYGDGPLVLLKNSPFNFPFLNSHRGDFSSADIDQHIVDLFPEGLSIHGWQFATAANWWSPVEGVIALEHSHAIELVFEYVRRALFQARPSRLQSYYAFDDLQRVRTFAPTAPVFEMQAAHTFRADMTWLNVSNQLAVASYNAHRYWDGNPSATPDWEYLLVPPVAIELVPAQDE